MLCRLVGLCSAPPPLHQIAFFLMRGCPDNRKRYDSVLLVKRETHLCRLRVAATGFMQGGIRIEDFAMLFAAFLEASDLSDSLPDTLLLNLLLQLDALLVVWHVVQERCRNSLREVIDREPVLARHVRGPEQTVALLKLAQRLPADAHDTVLEPQ